jgi:serine/threonine protein kinase
MPVEPMVGTEFAGYRLNAVISRTNMSVVYLAEHPRLGHAIALKILAPELSMNDRFRERFVSESRIAAGLRHPNVIPIYDAGPCDGLLYIAMLHVSGADLRAILKERGRLSPDQALLLLGQAGRGLDAAHRQHLVHRDVKPGNMLVERGEDHDPDHVYLSDFGITKRALTHTGLTSTGQYVGTIDYIAPEQITGEQVDGRADIYSLGCVLYECLVGRVPFNKDYEQAIVYSHQHEAPTPPSEVCPDLPETIDSVIARATAKNPDDRYHSCHDLIDAAADVFGLRDQRPIRVATVISDRPQPPPQSTPRPHAAPPAAPRAEERTPESVDAAAPLTDRGARAGSHDGGTGGSPPSWEAPRRRTWVTPVLVGLGALIVGAAVATSAFLATRSNGGTTTIVGGTGTASGTTTSTGASGFAANTGGLQLVMDHRLLGHGQCQDTLTPVPGVPVNIGANAVEGISCQASRVGFPTIRYDVFLYPDTNTLKAVFQTVLEHWTLTRHWHATGDACRASGVWSGGPVKWLHPSENPPAPGHLGGNRACYIHRPVTLMVWTHMRNNGEPQPDHYDTLVVAASTNTGPGESLPSDLRNFWQFTRKALLAPIGKSITGQNLPPLRSIGQ